MRSQLSNDVIAAQVIGTTAGIAILLSFIVLFTDASSGEKLAALAAIGGGLIGAAGTAAAVYLTLKGQRRDDVEKVEEALQVEVAEFARLAVEYLKLSQAIEDQVDQVQIPMRDLPVLMYMPEPTIYSATADRISRLEYGSLLVAFHMRITEATAMARTTAASARPMIPQGRVVVVSEPMTNPESGKTLGTAWSDVCQLAVTLLRKDPNSRLLVGKLIEARLSDLDAALARSKGRYDDIGQPGSETK